MFTLFGIVLLVAGAILTFAIDRQADGLDLLVVGWILMAGGGLSLCVGMIRTAGVAAVSQRPQARAAGRDPRPDVAPGRPDGIGRHAWERHAA